MDPNCITYADGKSFEIGDTIIKFSHALPHSVEGSKLGYIITVTIRWDGKSVMHASDVQGPMSNEAKEVILDESPDRLILSGPPIYLQGFAIERKDIQKAKKNLIEISGKIPEVVVDHHLLRDLRCFDFLKSVKEESEGNIIVASEILGKGPNLLEARRKEFYRSAKF
jgi:predicted metallo-beta-lactamase superfamily hydrolase